MLKKFVGHRRHGAIAIEWSIKTITLLVIGVIAAVIIFLMLYGMITGQGPLAQITKVITKAASCAGKLGAWDVVGGLKDCICAGSAGTAFCS